MAGPGSGRSGKTALGGVLAAGALAFLWLACVAPTGRRGLSAGGGVFPMAGTLALGRGAGYLCWGAAGLLGLLLMPDKGVALLFLTFFGPYPVVKGRIESLRRLPLEWVLKLAYFNVILTLGWFVLRGLFLPNPPAWMVGNIPLLYGAGNVVFVIYDLGLSRLVGLLSARMGFGRRG